MNRRKTRTSPSRRPDTVGPARLRNYLVMAICGLTVVSGFFFAGRLHFSSMDYGMKNSRLRRQIDELEAEKRRLMLAREVSLSPSEIKRAAKKVGLVEDGPQTTTVAQVISTARDKALPQTPAAAAKPMIIKTAAVSPARPTGPQDLVRTAKLVKPSKSPSSAN